VETAEEARTAPGKRHCVWAARPAGFEGGLYALASYQTQQQNRPFVTAVSGVPSFAALDRPVPIVPYLIRYTWLGVSDKALKQWARWLGNGATPHM